MFQELARNSELQKLKTHEIKNKKESKQKKKEIYILIYFFSTERLSNGICPYAVTPND
jgi:hypothetical protein